MAQMQQSAAKTEPTTVSAIAHAPGLKSQTDALKVRASVLRAFAWITWAFIHVYLLVGFQHRIQVSLQWLWRYLTFERGARLIAQDDGEQSR